MSRENTQIQKAIEDMAIKQKQKATWEDGDYALFATYMEPGAVEILDHWDIAANKKLLDIACGSGQTAIPAAKRGCQVTGVDIAENLIRHARVRAAKSRVDANFDVGDAEDLAYLNKSFDVVLSMFGAMFAPQPEKVMSEIARVLKSGGKLYMANWTPDSMPAQMFKAVSNVVHPPAKLPSPVLWGDESTVSERLAGWFSDVQLTRKTYPQWHFPFDADDLVFFFRRYFGPVKRAFDSVGLAEQARLHEKLAGIYRRNSETRNGVLSITGGEYLEVIATRI